jgi:hypothetical protein
MATTRQVTCINKRNRQSPHERISHIGGAGWKVPEDAAIAGIKNGTQAFFVSVQGKSVWVVVATHEGREYLKTEADGVIPNNLLSLPECP